MSTIRVAVLMGGTSSERDVSLKSGRNVAAALEGGRFTVIPLDFTGDLAPILALKGQVDVVFPALHGPGGEDGRLQSVLDLLGIPYVGSGPLGSAMAMHKGITKILYREAGIPTPAGITLSQIDGSPDWLDANVDDLLQTVGVPCVVKPANEGSSYGVSIVKTAAELAPALAQAATLDRDIIIEQFVSGVEISVPILGTETLRALPAVEIIPKSGTYDYESKYTPGATEEICPARISAAAAEAAADYALRAHAVLGCRDLSRTDMIVDGDALTVLETNTLPGMTDTSLLPMAARTVGLSFAALVEMLVLSAHARAKSAAGA
ncbi:MAG: D-alanine--D-alanine ligase B [bacterium ADurb.Bin429]|nr:MAG: D-alanine--D-alanine ligase B [bacterium ADurb.Bin429]